MKPDLVFQFTSSAAVVAWLLLACALFVQRPAQRVLLLAAGRLAPLLLCLVYVVVLVQYWGSASGASFASFEGVVRLFSSPGKLLGGWIHYLAFDLFIGRWMVDDALASKQARPVLLACLLFAFLYGPAGLLVYCTFRTGSRWRRSAPAER